MQFLRGATKTEGAYYLHARSLIRTFQQSRRVFLNEEVGLARKVIRGGTNDTSTTHDQAKMEVIRLGHIQQWLYCWILHVTKPNRGTRVSYLLWIWRGGSCVHLYFVCCTSSEYGEVVLQGRSHAHMLGRLTSLQGHLYQLRTSSEKVSDIVLTETTQSYMYCVRTNARNIELDHPPLQTSRCCFPKDVIGTTTINLRASRIIFLNIVFINFKDSLLYAMWLLTSIYKSC